MEITEEPPVRKKRRYKTWMKVAHPIAPKSTDHYNINRSQNYKNFQHVEEAISTETIVPLDGAAKDDNMCGVCSVSSERRVSFEEHSNTSSPNLSASLSNNSISDNSVFNSSGDSSVYLSSTCDSSHRNASEAEDEISNQEDNPSEQPVESNSEPTEKSRDFLRHPVKDEFFDTPLHENTGTSKFDVLVMVMNFAFRHGLTGVAIEDLCKLINCMLGCEAIPILNHYWMKKIFGCVNYTIHFYCSQCQCYLGEVQSDFKRLGTWRCPIETCKTPCNLQTLNNGNFFVALPIEDQLRYLLETTDNIEEILSHRWTRSSDSECIADVFDASKYRALSSDGNILSERYNLSITCNTDGAVVFNSVKNTLYPIHFRVNEFPPNLRFDQNNSLLAGLYFGKKEPDMSLFMAPFVKELQFLYERGFEWSLNPCDKIVSKVVLLQCVLDSVAKPKVQKIAQFNGYYSCGYCLHPGVVLDYVSSNCVKFLMNNDVILYNDLSLSYTVTKYVTSESRLKTFHVEDRNDAMIRKDMMEADSIRENTPLKLRDDISIRGLKSSSVFCELPYFDMSFDFTIDYLHSVLLGTCKHLCTLWFDRENNPFYVGDDKLAEIENRLSTIAPPSSISRRPRPISEMGDWKGNEWRAWLLFYSICCMVGLLPSQYMKHYCLLVTAIFILLGDSISKDDLQKASWCLTQFVAGFSNLYGDPNVFYNVHLLLHLGKMVSIHGPLWCFSAFSFESANGCLIKLVKGTRSVSSQIVQKYALCKLLPETLSFYRVSDSVLLYCEDLLCYRVSKCVKRVGSVIVLNDQVRSKLSENEIAIFDQAGMDPSEFSYQRFLKNGVMYHARCYSRRGNKSDDSVVKLENGSYGVINRIIVHEDTNNKRLVSVLLRFFNIEHKYVVVNGQAKAQHLKCCNADIFGDMALISAENIVCKSILMVCGNDTFLTDFPNIYEKD